MPEDAKMPDLGALMVFCLYGGPMDGALVTYPLLEPDALYLVPIPRTDEPVRDVYAFSFANRTEKRTGNWVLKYERYIGYQGVPVQQPKKEQP